MVEWGVSSKCHSAQAPVSLARVTSYNYNYNCNYNYNYNYSLARVTSNNFNCNLKRQPALNVCVVPIDTPIEFRLPNVC